MSYKERKSGSGTSGGIDPGGGLTEETKVGPVCRERERGKEEEEKSIAFLCADWRRHRGEQVPPEKEEEKNQKRVTRVVAGEEAPDNGVRLSEEFCLTEFDGIEKKSSRENRLWLAKKRLCPCEFVCVFVASGVLTRPLLHTQVVLGGKSNLCKPKAVSSKNFKVIYSTKECSKSRAS